MKISKRQLRRIIREAQWGNFTGGAAPLDEPMRDSGPVPKDQLRKLADIFMNDMGMSADEVLKKPEFAEQGITDLRQLEEGKMKITKRQLQRIVREALDPTTGRTDVSGISLEDLEYQHQQRMGFLNGQVGRGDRGDIELAGEEIVDMRDQMAKLRVEQGLPGKDYSSNTYHAAERVVQGEIKFRKRGY